MSTIVIRINGTNVTADVIFSDAAFGSQVNGQPGPANLRVRDKGHIHNFKAGQTLTLDVDGTRVWGGWMTLVQPAYAFKVDDTTDATETERLWIITGVDYNMLFSKRFLINVAHPTKQIPNFPAGTHDDTLIFDMVANLLDLSGDGITTGGVDHVGSPNPDHAGNVGNPGDSWGAAMNIIRQPIGSIFYITPGKVLTYVDVDTADAPFALSDTPSGAEIGYADMTIQRDATNMVNDALVWGAGTSPSHTIKFGRSEDATSIAAHGRWQSGEFTTLLFRQASVDLRASTKVYGSPSNKRGGKDDAVAVTCTVFQSGFVAGQKVDFRSDVFGYHDVLPIRRMQITFPTPTSVQYTMTLSHDIDGAWSYYEFWFPKNDFIVPPIDLDPGHGLPPLPTPGGCVCGITDSFTRTATSEWGTSDSTIPWIFENPSDNGVADYFSVDGSSGMFAQTYVIDEARPQTSIYLPLAATPVEVRLTISGFPARAATSGDAPVFRNTFFLFDIDQTSSFANYFNLAYSHLSGGGVQSRITAQRDGGSSDVALWTNPGDGRPYNLHILVDATGMFANWWDASTPEPVGWMVSSIGTNSFIPAFGMLPGWQTGNTAFTYSEAISFDNLDITGVDRCTEHRFDNFNRSVGPISVNTTPSVAWGSSDFGTLWTRPFPGINSVFGVASGAGYATVNGFGGETFEVNGSGPWATPTGFVFVMKMKVDGIDSNAPSVFLYPNGSLIASLDVELDGSVLFLSDSGNNVSAAFTPPVAGEYFWIKWERAPGGVSRAKVWNDSDSEPDWVVSTTNADIDLPTGFGIDFESHDNTTDPLTFTVDLVDFVYDGKPCFQCPRFDDFNRSVSGDWSNGWTVINGAGTLNVDGSTGVVTLADGDFVILSKTAPDVEIPGFTQTGRFMFDDLPVSNQAIYFTSDLSDGGSGMGLKIATGASTDTGYIGIAGGGTGQVVFTSDWTAGVWYGWRWEHVPSLTDRLRVWKESDGEPGTWTVERVPQTASPALFGNAEIGLETRHYGTSIRMDYIDFDNGSCDPTPTVGSTGGTSSGRVCETAARTDATHYQLVGAYVPGSSEVTVNGLRVRRGVTLAYTEDPEAGTIIFNDPVTLGATVEVCYQANGSL